jgi:hypothetical protein
MNKTKIGTVEPIYKATDKKDYEKIGFVRGFIKKHKDIIDKDVFGYLDKLVN